eukprot:GHVR01148870.1.p1 GENE.GHVR01148870.1~~GHVR01148870.1.p1  ORF type:complete len:205 (+),score=47.94 GHVR01148870.1:68-682(+)
MSVVAEICLPGDGKERYAVVESQYLPRRGDLVVGVVTQRFPEHYLIDICCNFEATLPAYSFPSATKRNHPNLQVGSVVVCQVVSSSSDTGTEVTCGMSGDTKGWTTQENYLGGVNGGYEFKLPLSYAQYLQQDGWELTRIGEFKTFEVAIGVNGRVWVKGDNPRDVLNISETIKQCCLFDKESLKEALIVKKFSDKYIHTVFNE